MTKDQPHDEQTYEERRKRALETLALFGTNKALFDKAVDGILEETDNNALSLFVEMNAADYMQSAGVDATEGYLDGARFVVAYVNHQSEFEGRLPKIDPKVIVDTFQQIDSEGAEFNAKAKNVSAEEEGRMRTDKILSLVGSFDPLLRDCFIHLTTGKFADPRMETTLGRIEGFRFMHEVVQAQRKINPQAPNQNP